MVIENHPRLDDGSPFPTLYWVTCPVLNKRISRLESSGWMAALNETLARNDELKKRLESTIDRYRRRRDEHEMIVDADAPPGGGPERVKCVHAHVAHELVERGNPVGALALAAVGWPDCRQACFGVEGRDE